MNTFAMACIVATIFTAAVTARPAPSPASHCHHIDECITYLIEGSLEESPNPSCCNLIDEDFDCICEAFDLAAAKGYTINMSKADDLPSACSVNSPPLSSCKERSVSLKATAPTPSSSSSESGDCSLMVYDFVDCMSFLSKGSKDSKPSSGCCSGFKSIADKKFDCVCEALTTAPRLEFEVNYTRAEVLPSLCKVKSPAISTCNVSSTPSSPVPTNTSSPAPSADCSTIAYDMIDCISFLTPGGNIAKPSSSCCSGYQTVVNTDFDCVCVALQTAPTLGMPIDESKAEKLAGLCNVKSPPVSSCTSGGAPSISPPAQSPPPSSVSAPPPPSAAPSAGNDSDCATIAYDMIDCISYLTPGGDSAKPSSSCCDGFKTVVNTNFDCVCVALQTAPTLGMPIDESKAEKMPRLCKVKSPPLSSCSSTSGSGSPPPAAAAPGNSPPPAAAAPGNSPHPAAAAPVNSPPPSSTSSAGSPQSSSPAPSSPGVVPPSSPAGSPGKPKSSGAETIGLSFVFTFISSLTLFVALA